MALDCRGCGNDKAYHLSMKIIEGVPYDICDRCGLTSSSMSSVPDVFWPGHAYKSENILDSHGQPILLTSRRHKADVMRQQGLSEAGDTHHGSRMGIAEKMVPKRETNSRAEIRAAMTKAREILRQKYRR